MTGVLVQVNVSNGGMPKLPVQAVHVSRDGLAGDWQTNRKYHGGPDQAICLFSEELYHQLRDEHNINLTAGAVGENFTTRGINLQRIVPGDRLQVGDCLIEITMIRTPCRSLNKSDPRLMSLMIGRSGWKAKVVEEGAVRPGDTIQVLKQQRG